MSWGLNLKSFTDKLQDGLSELERNLAQPVIRPATPDPPPNARPPTQRSVSSSSNAPASTPPKPRVTTDVGARPSLDSPGSERAAGSPNAERSASQLAEGAMSSLRAQLKAKRLAAEAARNGGVAKAPPAPAREESAPTTPVKEKPAPVEQSVPPPVAPQAELKKEDEKPETHALRLSLDDPTAALVPVEAVVEERSQPQEPAQQTPAPVPTGDLLDFSDEPASSVTPEPTPAEPSALEAAPPAAVETPAPQPAEIDSAQNFAQPQPEAESLPRPTSPESPFALAGTADATPAITREATPAPPAAEEAAKEEAPATGPELVAETEAEPMTAVGLPVMESVSVEEAQEVVPPVLQVTAAEPEAPAEKSTEVEQAEVVEPTPAQPEPGIPVETEVETTQVPAEITVLPEVEAEPTAPVVEEIAPAPVSAVELEPVKVDEAETTPALVTDKEEAKTAAHAALDAQAAVVEHDSPPVPADKDLAQPPAPKSSAPDPRLADITAAYKRLQTLKSTLDRIVSEVTPLSGVSDVDAFEGELRNMKGKTEMSMAEIGRLNAELKLQKERFAEVREAHKQETREHTERIDSLQSQLSSKDDALKLLAGKVEKADDATATVQTALSKANDEAVKLRQTAKDEEEKRTKALSLLRALRQKLVKTEKDKEEAEAARDAALSSAAQAGTGSKADKVKFDSEITSLRAAQEQQLAKLRQSFEKDHAAQKAAAEREAAARKAQFELDAITAKASHNKELAGKDTRVSQLEKTVKELQTARDGLFDQLQMRTAEAESSSAHHQSLQGQTGELQYELQEARDKAAALLEEVEELRKARRDVARDEGNTRRLLAEAEARHESKIRDLTARARQMEKERQEAEEEGNRNLQARLKEVERMRETIVQKDAEHADSVRESKQAEQRIQAAEKARAELEAKLKESSALLRTVKSDQEEAQQTEAALREELAERATRSGEIESRLEEVQAKESQLRSNNKILRDELRKLQSGVALRETARAPGVGYFASHSSAQPPLPNNASVPTSPGSLSENGSPSISQGVYGAGPASSSTLSLVPGGPGANPAQASEEAINFEYLRNLLLQFLEKPEMRPHLISVMSVVLRFTPSEQRRLVAKAGGR